MENIAFDRINDQIASANIINKPIFSKTPEIKSVEPEVALPNALPLDELKELLSQEALPQTHNLNKTLKKFEGIEDFVAWYVEKREKFTDNQNIALQTLVQIRDATNIGCSCRRNQRLIMANEHFKNFWEKNKFTDLPLKVMEVGGFTNLIFSIPGNIEFLKL
jgi:hypothetical protein